MSCTTTKNYVKMPKWEKEHKSSKRKIRKYTKDFVDSLYSLKVSADTSEIENIIQK